MRYRSSCRAGLAGPSLTPGGASCCCSLLHLPLLSLLSLLPILLLVLLQKSSVVRTGVRAEGSAGCQAVLAVKVDGKIEVADARSHRVAG